MTVPTNIPTEYKRHNSSGEAFLFRVKKIRQLIDLFRIDSKWALLTKNILGNKWNPPRNYYDFQASAIIYRWLVFNVPFRKDVVNVETLQYPEITINLGGD